MSFHTQGRAPYWVRRRAEAAAQEAHRRREKAAVMQDAADASLEELEAAEAAMDHVVAARAPCPACGGPEKVFVIPRGDLGTVCRCRGCHYIWTERRADR